MQCQKLRPLTYPLSELDCVEKDALDLSQSHYFLVVLISYYV